MPEAYSVLNPAHPVFKIVVKKISGETLEITPGGVAPAVAEEGAAADGQEAGSAVGEAGADQELEVSAGALEDAGEAGQAPRRLVVRSQTADGQAIPNAAFLLIKPDGTEERSQTDEHGEKVFEGLPPGRYRVRFLKPDELEKGPEAGSGPAGDLAGKAKGALGGLLR